MHDRKLARLIGAAGGMDEWVVIGVIGFILVCVYRIFKPKIKGLLGEKSVALILSVLPKEEYEIINNVIIKTDKGSSQIDHIVVSSYGVFVIETKNYKGWISGKDISEKWVQNIYGKKFLFRNPIKQNYGHVQALKEISGLQESQFIPIIVFSNEANLRVKTKNTVIYTVNLIKEIKSHTDELIEKEKLNEIVRLIKESNVDSKEERVNHVETIRKNISIDKEKVKSGICPKCGGSLVKRKGKYGDFMGCSGYPKCRFTI